MPLQNGSVPRDALRHPGAMRHSHALRLRRSLRLSGVPALALALVPSLSCVRASISRSVPTSSTSDARYDIALIGDQQYRAATEPDFVRLMQAIDTASVAFVVHVGDIKAGATPCTDSLLTARRDQFDRSMHPFVYLFGDNEWSDCYVSGFDPLERQRRLRELFTAGDRSLGRSTITLERQSSDPRFSEYRENVRWVRGPVVYIGLDVPGTSQTHRRGDAEEREYRRRTDANVAWLRDGFRVAAERGLPGVMVLFQANPMLDRTLLPDEARRRFAEHDPIVAELRSLTLSSGRQVALVHGDFHYFEIDMPFRDSTTNRVIPNFTRVQVFGDPNADWVRAEIDAGDPRVFRFYPVVVP
jgi:hypothetical protein